MYDENCIVSESKVWNQHIDKRQANWMQTHLKNSLVRDEVELFNLGAPLPREYFSYGLSQLGISYSNDFGAYYKIAGFTVFRDFNLHKINRSTYDMLQYLGDVGGLDRILVFIGMKLAFWFAQFASVAQFMRRFYFYRL